MWPMIPFPLSPFALPPASPHFYHFAFPPTSIFHPPLSASLFGLSTHVHPLSFCFFTRIRPLPFCFSIHIRSLPFCLSIRIRSLPFLPFQFPPFSTCLKYYLTQPFSPKAHLALSSLFISIFYFVYFLFFFVWMDPFYPALTPPPLISWDHTTDHYRSRNATSKI